MGSALVHAYGADSAPLAVYFHGAPGGPGECARFDGVARACGVRLACIDRSVVAADLEGEPYFQTLAREVDALAGGAPVTLIGFSLGAFVALRTAPHLAGRIASIHLISAGAPLESGDFLDGMAGKAVFRMAARSPRLFRRLSRFQGWLAAHAPGVLFRMLFATATGRDRDLARDEGFRSEIGAVLKGALACGAGGYVRDVETYVRPWATRLAEVTADTHLWHGAEDNWAPATMAHRLQALVPGVSRIEIMPGLSHYSCLFQAVPRILAEIGGATPQPRAGELCA